MVFTEDLEGCNEMDLKNIRCYDKLTLRITEVKGNSTRPGHCCWLARESTMMKCKERFRVSNSRNMSRPKLNIEYLPVGVSWRKK